MFYSEVAASTHSKPWPFQTPGLQAHQAPVAPHTQAFDELQLGVCPHFKTPKTQGQALFYELRI
jgi:hypothetical protein